MGWKHEAGGTPVQRSVGRAAVAKRISRYKGQSEYLKNTRVKGINSVMMAQGVDWETDTSKIFFWAFFIDECIKLRCRPKDITPNMLRLLLLLACLGLLKRPFLQTDLLCLTNLYFDVPALIEKGLLERVRLKDGTRSLTGRYIIVTDKGKEIIHKFKTNEMLCMGKAFFPERLYRKKNRRTASKKLEVA